MKKIIVNVAILILTAITKAYADYPCPEHPELMCQEGSWKIKDKRDKPTVGSLSVRIVDAPIVRSSKGCIAFLGETKSGAIVVSPMLGKNGKPICRPELTY